MVREVAEEVGAMVELAGAKSLRSDPVNLAPWLMSRGEPCCITQSVIVSEVK